MAKNYFHAKDKLTSFYNAKIQEIKNNIPLQQIFSFDHIVPLFFVWWSLLPLQSFEKSTRAQEFYKSYVNLRMVLSMFF